MTLGLAQPNERMYFLRSLWLVQRSCHVVMLVQGEQMLGFMSELWGRSSYSVRVIERMYLKLLRITTEKEVSTKETRGCQWEGRKIPLCSHLDTYFWLYLKLIPLLNFTWALWVNKILYFLTEASGSVCKWQEPNPCIISVAMLMV